MMMETPEGRNQEQSQNGNVEHLNERTLNTGLSSATNDPRNRTRPQSTTSTTTLLRQFRRPDHHAAHETGAAGSGSRSGSISNSSSVVTTNNNLISHSGTTQSNLNLNYYPATYGNNISRPNYSDTSQSNAVTEYQQYPLANQTSATSYPPRSYTDASSYSHVPVLPNTPMHCTDSGNIYYTIGHPGGSYTVPSIAPPIPPLMQQPDVQPVTNSGMYVNEISNQGQYYRNSITKYHLPVPVPTYPRPVDMTSGQYQVVPPYHNNNNRGTDNQNYVTPSNNANNSGFLPTSRLAEYSPYIQNNVTSNYRHVDFDPHQYSNNNYYPNSILRPSQQPDDRYVRNVTETVNTVNSRNKCAFSYPILEQRLNQHQDQRHYLPNNYTGYTYPMNNIITPTPTRNTNIQHSQHNLILNQMNPTQSRVSPINTPQQQPYQNIIRQNRNEINNVDARKRKIPKYDPKYIEQINYEWNNNARYEQYIQQTGPNEPVPQPPQRNISPRRTFQENMPVVVIPPQQIGLPGHSSTTGAQYNVPTSGSNHNIHQDIASVAGVQYSGIPNYLQQNVPRSQNATTSLQNTNVVSYRNFEASFRSRPEGHISLKEFLESWDDEEDIVANLPDLVLNIGRARQYPGQVEETCSSGGSGGGGAAYSSEDEDPRNHDVNRTERDPQPLYILDSTNITSDLLPNYSHLQQIDRLPDNIKGYFNKDKNKGESDKQVSKTNENAINLTTVQQSKGALNEVLNLTTSRNKPTAELLPYTNNQTNNQADKIHNINASVKDAFKTALSNENKLSTPEKENSNINEKAANGNTDITHKKNKIKITSVIVCNKLTENEGDIKFNRPSQVSHNIVTLSKSSTDNSNRKTNSDLLKNCAKESNGTIKSVRCIQITEDVIPIENLQKVSHPENTVLDKLSFEKMGIKSTTIDEITDKSDENNIQKKSCNDKIIDNTDETRETKADELSADETNTKSEESADEQLSHDQASVLISSETTTEQDNDVAADVISTIVSSSDINITASDLTQSEKPTCSVSSAFDNTVNKSQIMTISSLSDLSAFNSECAANHDTHIETNNIDENIVSELSGFFSDEIHLNIDNKIIISDIPSLEVAKEEIIEYDTVNNLDNDAEQAPNGDYQMENEMFEEGNWMLETEVHLPSSKCIPLSKQRDGDISEKEMERTKDFEDELNNDAQLTNDEGLSENEEIIKHDELTEQDFESCSGNTDSLATKTLFINPENPRRYRDPSNPVINLDEIKDTISKALARSGRCSMSNSESDYQTLEESHNILSSTEFYNSTPTSPASTTSSEKTRRIVENTERVLRRADQIVKQSNRVEKDSYKSKFKINDVVEKLANVIELPLNMNKTQSITKFNALSLVDYTKNYISTQNRRNITTEESTTVKNIQNVTDANSEVNKLNSLNNSKKDVNTNKNKCKINIEDYRKRQQIKCTETFNTNTSLIITSSSNNVKNDASLQPTKYNQENIKETTTDTDTGIPSDDKLVSKINLNILLPKSENNEASPNITTISTDSAKTPVEIQDIKHINVMNHSDALSTPIFERKSKEASSNTIIKSKAISITKISNSSSTISDGIYNVNQRLLVSKSTEYFRSKHTEIECTAKNKLFSGITNINVPNLQVKESTEENVPITTVTSTKENSELVPKKRKKHLKDNCEKEVLPVKRSKAKSSDESSKSSKSQSSDLKLKDKHRKSSNKFRSSSFDSSTISKEGKDFEYNGQVELKCHINLKDINDLGKEYKVNKSASDGDLKLRLTKKTKKTSLENLTELKDSKRKVYSENSSGSSNQSGHYSGSLVPPVVSRLPTVLFVRTGSEYSVYSNVSSDPNWQPVVIAERIDDIPDL